MDTYQWQKNNAIVCRLYYTERIVLTTWGFAGLYTATNMLFIKKGYFSPLMRTRIMPIWAYTTAFNLAMAFIMLKPLRSEEISAQVTKRLNLGKWLCSVYHLPWDENDGFLGASHGDKPE